MSCTLKRSVGTNVSTTLNPITARQTARKGDATATTPGTSGFDTITLKTPTLDTAYDAATSLAPIKLGIDDIHFIPLLYPEAL